MRSLRYSTALVTAGLFGLLLALPGAAIDGRMEEWVNTHDSTNDASPLVAADPDGNVWLVSIAHTGNHILWRKLAPNGSLLLQREDPQNGADDELNAIAVDANGGVVVTGQIRHPGSPPVMFVTKRTSDGTKLWGEGFDQHGIRTRGTAVTMDGDGHVYVTGWGQAPGGQNDAFTVKLRHSDGARMWLSPDLPTGVATYNNPYSLDDQPVALKLDGQANLYVAGHSIAPPGDGVQDAAYTVWKYSATTGALAWIRHYNGPGYDEARDLGLDAAGNVYVTGLSNPVGGYEPSILDIATAKFNSAGVFQWDARYDGANSLDIGQRLSVDPNGDVYVAGTSTGAVSKRDFLVLKYSKDGAPLWERRYDSDSHRVDIPIALTRDPSGNLFVTGTSGSTGDADDPDIDYLTVAYSATGAELWQSRYTSSGIKRDVARSAAADPFGNLYVTGLGGGFNSPLSQFPDIITLKYGGTPDTIPPTCSAGSVQTVGGRVFLPLTVTDSGCGVARVELTSRSTNCYLEGPTGEQGSVLNFYPTLASAVVKAVKINSSKKAVVELRVTDCAGNSVVCDPVIASLVIKKGNRRMSRTFNRIPEQEHYVAFQNGVPGLTHAKLWVNGKSIAVGALSDGETRVVDTRQWMRAGKRNSVRVVVTGLVGATAMLLIGDASLVGGGGTHRPMQGRVNLDFSP